MAGEIELAPIRDLTHFIGHDSAGLWGRTPAYKTVAAMLAATAVLVVGSTVRAAGYDYTVVSTGEHLTNAGGTKLKFIGDRIPADAFGADPTGVVDSTAAFNLAMQVAVATKKPGYSSGTYKMTDTLAPGGRYVWDWGDTILEWASAAGAAHTITGFTELLYNPTGSSTPQLSGKRVLFDTLGCINAQNAGILTINGFYPGNMNLASRAAINPNIVAISCSTGNSADMVWNSLYISGCGHGLWQGDQRGTATNILPYTRWVLGYLQIRFSLVPIESGLGGNGLDDMFIGNLRITRCSGRSSLMQTDLGGGVAFLNGLGPDAGQDLEPQTISITAASPTATLSADNTLIVVGSIVVIADAGLNKAGGATYFAARVTAKTTVTLTLERNAEITASGLEIVANPPEMFLQNSSWRFQQTYLEEIHETPMRLYARSAIRGIVKVSNGHISSRYDCGVLLQTDSFADVELHAKVVNATGVKRVIGVGSSRTSGSYNSNHARVKVPAPEAFLTGSDPIGIVALYAAHLPSEFPTEASGEENRNLNLEAAFTDVTCYYQRHAVGSKVRFRSRNGGGLELAAPLLIAASTEGGNFSSPAGGSSNKTTGGNGTLIHPVTASKTYRVAITASVVTTIAAQIRWYLAGVSVSTEATITRGPAGRYIMYVTVPASGVDQLALFASTTEVFTVTEFSVAEVLSL